MWNMQFRLRQLAKLERIALETERGKLMEEAGGLEHLLSDEKAMRRQIVKEIRALANPAKGGVGDERRTVLNPVAESGAKKIKAIKTVPSEPVTIVLSEKGFIRSRTGHNIEVGNLSWKSGDRLLDSVETLTDSDLVLFDSKGRTYCIQASDVPGGRGEGVPVSSLISLQPGARILAMLSGDPAATYLVCSDAGYGFVANLESMMSKRRGGKDFLTVPEGHKALAPVRIEEGNDLLVAVRTIERGLIFPLSDIKVLPKGKGVKLIAADDGEIIEGVWIVDPGKKGPKPFGNPDRFLGKRAGHGKVISVGKRGFDSKPG